MKEQFDKELRNHIKDTFGVFDDHLADDGWRKLIDRKKRKRRGFIFWYVLPSGVAASIALFLLLNQGVNIPVSLEKAEDKIESLTKQNPVQDLNKSNSEKLNPDKNNEEFSDHIMDLEITQKNSLEIKKPKLKIRTEQLELDNELAFKRENSSLALPNTSIEREGFNIDDTEKVASIETLVKLKETESIDNLTYFMDRDEKISVKEKEFNTLNNEINQSINSPLIEKSMEISKKLATSAKAKVKRKKSASNNDKFKIGIDANTYVNFSENGINDKINLGLGLISEIKLTKQLSISTGVALNSQNSTFSGNQKSTQDFLKSAAAFSNIAVIPSAQITNAKLVGLDIPLNLKYGIKFGKTNSFISSGFSSYSVINEKYVNEFSVINYSINGAITSNVTSVNNNPGGKFSYFKFARTLDVSIGILYPLSKKSTLSVEPFIKYPLSGLGYQDLKIGASGISFKINFGK
jgi:hypothetical protein